MNGRLEMTHSIATWFVQRGLALTLTGTVAVFAMSCGEDDAGNEQNNIIGKDAPTLTTDVDEIRFVDVALGDEDLQRLRILNTGKGLLKISSLKLVETTVDDPGKEEFRKGEDWVNSAELEPNVPLDISVIYAPARSFIAWRCRDSIF